ncbi:hypothetical protein EB822_02020 [Flavobacteriaceae bacterium PRS1]|nr:hypothetical protein EB822_02020 [Flavobacteriaceae bacterium PRS1]
MRKFGKNWKKFTKTEGNTKKKQSFLCEIFEISRYSFKFYISNLTFSLYSVNLILGRTQV